MNVERYDGKIVLTTIELPQPIHKRIAKNYGLLLIQFLAMTTKYTMTFGFLTFFAVWTTDVGYWLWIACVAFSVIMILVTSQVVTYIKRKRGVI